jgi:hypothetical protein
MSLEILILKLDGITAGEYLTWCRDSARPPSAYAHTHALA